MRQSMLAAAYGLDWLAGDPAWFPHPVRIMGYCAQRGEAALRPGSAGPTHELAAGSLLTLCIAAGFATAAHALVKSTYRASPSFGAVVEVTLAWTCLASRSLVNEADSVIAALHAEDLPGARRRLARIVGRDTQHLDASDICRALIETLAESCSDGIIAPLAYLAAGGVPLAIAYKAINTLDSMIGHTDSRYFHFGKCAARLDDCVNYVPARITAAVIVVAARASWPCAAQRSLSTWLRDGGKHKSPNAGHPEAAMAGALRVRLGGSNTYGGEVLESPFLGAEFPPPVVADAQRAVCLTCAVSFLGFAAAWLFLHWKRS